MLFREITLQNFRSYKDAVEINNLSDVNTFIGPNAAGKTNVFEALKYLKAMARIGGDVKAFGELVFDGDLNLDMRVRVVFSLSNMERTEVIESLFVDSPKNLVEEIKKSPFLSELIWDVNIKKEGVVREEIRIKNVVDGELVVFRWGLLPEEHIIKFESTGLDKKCKGFSEMGNVSSEGFAEKARMGVGFEVLRVAGHLDQAEQNLIDILRRYIVDWTFYGPIRQCQARLPLGEEARLDPSGVNLTRFLNTLQTNNPRRFVALTDDVIKVLPLVEEILAPARGSEATIAVQEHGLKTAVGLSNISFGLTQILVFVYGIVTAPESAVIFIEEPELHLHASSQRRLFGLIQREAEQRQFFLTTHSSIFTGCTDKVRTYLVIKSKGATSVKQIKEPSELKLVKTALGHRNTDLYGDECVVFIEGDSEEVAFPIIAEATGYDLVERGIRLINLKGAGKAKKLEEYLRYLKDSDVEIYIIADNDKEISKKLKDWEREGLLKEDCATVWPLEFEDCFDLQIITKAINELSKEQELNFSITVEELRNGKEKGGSVVKLIQKMFNEKDLPDLNKPALSEKIALILKEEIKNPKHERTPSEQVIEKIVNLVKPKREM